MILTNLITEFLGLLQLTMKASYHSGTSMTHISRIGLISIILILLPGCVVGGGYSSERGWFLWPGTIVIFLVGILLLFLFRRRR